MRWFKHFTDNHRGRSMQALMDELGHLGPCSYYFLVEMCAEKLEQKSDRNLEEADCLFCFHQRIVRQNLRISPVNLRRLLDICQTFGLFSFEIDGSSLKISMPILLDLFEYDQKKSRQRRAKIAPESRLEKNREEKSRVEKEKSKRESKTPTPISDDFQISDSVKAWATKNGHTQLEKHLESFINKCKAKNYKYSDWDAAFRNAIADNWAKVGQAQLTQDKSFTRWDATLASTMARGKELGILPKVGETEGQYRERLKQGGA